MIRMADIYAVDFDGTLCENRYPEIGKPIVEVIEYIRQRKAEGHQLVLWTCRTDDNLQKAVDWCADQGIEFDAINENLQETIDEFGCDPRKVSANHYIDDKAITAESIINGQVMQNMTRISSLKQFKPMWDLKQSTSPETLELYIYGEVTDMEIDWERYCYVESENSANHFREELGKHSDAKQINIYINSTGGSVYEGTAIYNQLKRHTAQKTVFIDGFACSVASVIAMAGDIIIMPKNAMMMIHNMWMWACGNARELRKAADDLDIISKGNRQAYMQKAGDKITEEQLISMLDEETWLTAEDCIKYGLADEYAEKDADLSKAKEMLQKANLSIQQRIDIQKSLAAQLREMTSPLPEDPVPTPSPAPVVPVQNKIHHLLAAFER